MPAPLRRFTTLPLYLVLTRATVPETALASEEAEDAPEDEEVIFTYFAETQPTLPLEASLTLCQ